MNKLNKRQQTINKLIYRDDYLSRLAKECILDASSTERKMFESIKDLAAKMFCVRVEDETPLDNIKYDVSNIRESLDQF